MNWKNVLYLVRVDRKSGRLLRGQKLTRYNPSRSRLTTFAFYFIAIAVGLGVGFLAQFIYSAAVSAEPNLQALFLGGYYSFLFSLPTISLLVSLIFTMLQQIQRSGVRATYQVPYWLPVTWEEHTVASVLAEVLGFPLISVAFISSLILVFSAFVGGFLSAIAAVLLMVAAAFMASALTEVFRILQVRFTGAVYKSTGRAAVWVRFVSSLVFFAVFYFIYFYIVSGAGPLVFVQTVASVQSAAWFVPFVWLGLTLFSLATGLLLQGTLFLALSLLFIAGLIYLGTLLNKRFGLYEPPAITVSRGTYTPKTGVLGRIGFSSAEAALVRKDLKAFTRRRELMATFILPIVFLILPIMTSLNTSPSTSAGDPFGQATFFLVFTTLLPVSMMAVSLGSFIIGEEGQGVWRIYASPISARNLVKSKYAFLLFFSLIVLPITGTAGFLIYQPSLRAMTALVLESIFLVFALGALSLANGIKGADFTEIPRPRMIRVEWSLINFIACAAVALAILAPLLAYELPVALFGTAPLIELYQALIISGVVAAVLGFAFYRLALENAEELIAKAET